MPLYLDISGLCECHTDEALELFHKAASEPPDDGVWEPHPSPFVRRLIELFTQRGLTRLAGMEAELRKWLAGDMHEEGRPPPRPQGAMERWSRTELGLVKLYLERLPPDSFTLDDWLMVIDYLAQRYLPADDLRSEAEWLATRAALMGRVEAAMGDATPEQADKLLRVMPSTVAAAESTFSLGPAQRALLEYGRARCAENVVGLGDGARRRLRRFIVDYQEAEMLGRKAETSEALQSRLLDEFGTMNRDWRRIAVTEAGENRNQGVIASLAPGARVKRIERYGGACAFCRSIDGKVMTVVAADALEKDGETQVWPGKTNVGRLAAPRRREGGRLVERAAEQRWWVPAGTVHPHCRGGWVPIEEGSRPVDPKFSAWMDEVLGRK